MEKEIIDVTAALILQNDLILIAKRAKGKHLEGLWEFPGGKIRKSESPQECLIREIKEELKVDVEIGEHIIDSVHEYEKLTIRLKAYLTLIKNGNISLVEHQEMENRNWRLEIGDFRLTISQSPINQSPLTKITRR